MSKLFAGPWVGEFGWELFGFQGYVRHMAKKKNYDEIIVSSRSGHEILYQDFMTQFVPHDPASTQTDMHRLKGWKYDRMHDNYISSKDTWISPDSYRTQKHEFVNYGYPSEELHYDLLIHARSTGKHRTDVRNWPEEKWDDLIKKLKTHYGNELSIGCIGSPHAALHMKDTTDLRGISLEKLTNILASSSLLIGPSSGPMHLGSLCRIPHVVWAQQKGWAIDNKARYETVWNPFDTPIKFIGKHSWQPPVDIVFNTITNFNQITL
jgi:hypothetical protein